MFFISVLFFSHTGLIWAQYPEIQALNVKDIFFKQIQTDIQAYYQAAAKNLPEQVPTLVFFTYAPKKGEDLLFLAARFNLPYETLATLNRMENKNKFSELARILVPNLPGLFIPQEAESDLEMMMVTWRKQKLSGMPLLKVHAGETIEEFFFFPGEKFIPLERAYFLRVLFRFPLKKGAITSYYGIRIHPVYKTADFHTGIDIGAPVGTEVLAAREGIVLKTGFSDGYGNYIILSHAGGYSTVYAHLSEIKVVLNQEVYSGMIIGRVGSSGLSTGPHLHFEIRQKGTTKDPESLLIFGH